MSRRQALQTVRGKSRFAPDAAQRRGSLHDNKRARAAGITCEDEAILLNTARKSAKGLAKACSHFSMDRPANSVSWLAFSFEHGCTALYGELLLLGKAALPAWVAPCNCQQRLRLPALQPIGELRLRLELVAVVALP